jgi:hypothetical protein
MWPFKKAGQKLESLPIEESWTVAQGMRNGNPIFVRFNNVYRGTKGVKGYEHQAGIAVPLNQPDDSGLPSSAQELQELDEIEEVLCALAESDKESILVASISTSGMREFVFYTRKPEGLKEKFLQARGQVTGHELQLMIQPDGDWQVYARLTH